MNKSLDRPLYADKPKRVIPDTNGCVAVTLYASKDRSVRSYVLFDGEGRRLGSVSWHSRSLGRSAGYHEGMGVWRHDDRTWSNLTMAAITLKSEQIN